MPCRVAVETAMQVVPEKLGPDETTTHLQLPQRERVQAVHVHDHVAGARVQLGGAAHQQPHRRPERLLPQRPNPPRQPVLRQAGAEDQSVKCLRQL
jgi:hypothetical protein